MRLLRDGAGAANVEAPMKKPGMPGFFVDGEAPYLRWALIIFVISNMDA